MDSRIVVIGLAAAALFAVTACGAIEGTPSPNAGAGTEPSTSTGTTSATTGTTSAGAPAALHDADPCGLVTEEDVERAVGALDGEPRRNDLGTARSCEYEVDKRLLVVDVRTNVGLAGVNATGPVTDQTIGGHRVKSWVSQGGTCFFVLGVTESSRVDITLQPKTGGVECEPAKRLADVVEPKLP
ncbi:DUF3558 family protein [Saccharothrix sp. 6-C]|uniref:DUF3558 family protein n=1 Tax=Saccharothrix sp. 6-C TaxID=2781735 RepID=UPI0019174D81|nr:DUF3558 family protein [Saccharothrix sp. 6-C]QQQ75531.1 DUF3558 family protein [Saccharothrix sp. 6-C]